MKRHGIYAKRTRISEGPSIARRFLKSDLRTLSCTLNFCTVYVKFNQTEGVGFDQNRYETEFDAFVEKQFAKTMGNIIREVEKLPEITPELRTRISDAKKRRDFLTHHYWRERSEEFITRRGRAAMRVELEDDANMFHQLDLDVSAALSPTLKRLGIKEEWLEAHFEKIKKELIAKDN
jgi:hypothetical protein